MLDIKNLKTGDLVYPGPNSDSWTGKLDLWEVDVNYSLPEDEWSFMLENLTDPRLSQGTSGDLLDITNKFKDWFPATPTDLIRNKHIFTKH